MVSCHCECVQFHLDSAGRSSPTFKSAVRFFCWIVRNSLITVFLLQITVEFLCGVDFYVLLGLHDIRKNCHWACDIYCEKIKEISPHTCSVLFMYRCIFWILIKVSSSNKTDPSLVLLPLCHSTLCDSNTSGERTSGDLFWTNNTFPNKPDKWSCVLQLCYLRVM